jgi:hypothetical protein
MKTELFTWLKCALIGLFGVFAPIEGALATVVILTLTDLVTGVLAAKKRGDKIISFKVGRTISKIILFEIALMLGFIAERYLMGNILPVVKLIGGAIGMRELLSCLENLDVIFGVDVFQAMIDKLSGKSDKNLPPKA